MIELDTLKDIMEAIKEFSYPRSKQVEAFIGEVLEHFGETREGQ